MSGTNIIARLRAYFDQYMAWASPDQSLAVALWVVGTYLWQHFDCYPYLCVTKNTKRAGGTRCMELVSFTACNARRFIAPTPASVYRSIAEEAPTLCFDEAEKLNNEHSELREVLNGGYRRGQTKAVVSKTGIVEMPLYCPKVFVLIGDVLDTLRDRSIIIWLQRGQPSRRFVWNDAEAEGRELGMAVKAIMDEMGGTIMERFTRLPMYNWLNDRDAEIWMPLFAIAEVLAPELVNDVHRVAADLCALKTAPKRDPHAMMVESKAQDDKDYGEQLLGDMLTAMGTAKHLYTKDVLAALKAIPTAPWRTFRGAGLTDIDMAALLSAHAVKPKLIRTNGKRADAKVARGYTRADVEAALSRC